MQIEQNPTGKLRTMRQKISEKSQGILTFQKIAKTNCLLKQNPVK
jgi:hypothetical protein